MIAILGLGALGSIFAQRASRAGLHVTAWNRSPVSDARFDGENIRIARTAAEAVREADAVVTILFDGAAVFGVMRDLQAFDAMKPGSTWLQMSTIGVEDTKRAIDLAATRPEIDFIDAPVSGSRYVAQKGNLIVLASGDRQRASVAVQPFIDAIAGKVHWLGEAGQGTRMILLLSAWIGNLIENIAEITILSQALGIERKRFLELVSSGELVPPWALEKFERIAANRTSEVEVPLRLVEKNLGLALSGAGPARRRLPILQQISVSWADAIRDFEHADIAALYLALER